MEEKTQEQNTHLERRNKTEVEEEQIDRQPGLKEPRLVRVDTVVLAPRLDIAAPALGTELGRGTEGRQVAAEGAEGKWKTGPGG